MMNDPVELKREFLETLGNYPQIDQLFDHLPDVYFFAKNRLGQFVMANRSFAQQCGVRSVDELIGKTDLDFFPPDLAGTYAQDDQYVMRTGKSIVNRVELFVDSDGVLTWFTTTKVPLLDREGTVVGVAGTARDFQEARHAVQPYEQMAKVVRFIRDHYGEQIPIADLASLVSLSVSQFQRRFKSIFHDTPLQYINRIRITAACRQLRDSDDTISTVALRCGFYDHSYFTKQFVKHMGVLPKEYRARERTETGRDG